MVCRFTDRIGFFVSLFTLVLVMFPVTGAFGSNPDSVKITGELKKWHKVTLQLEGENLTESWTTFRDYRLDVIFTNGEEKFIVPGHFAADGNAAYTGADRGRLWRVYFTPNKTGEWKYLVSFRKGKDVAIGLDASTGEPYEPFDGLTGRFAVTASDKDPADFRAKGLMRYVGAHYQQFAEDGTYWIAVGTGSPENLLGGSDFDNIHVGENWIADHIQDWKEGDPTWRDGKGKGVIGAVNYMLDLGMNTLWLSLMNAYCDPEPTSTEVYPWPGKEVTAKNLSTFDVSKLDQWEIVLEHAQNRGMALHILLGEEEAEGIWEKAEGLEVGGEKSFAGTRKLYYREVVSRFGYFNAMDWNMGEEFGFGFFPTRNTPQQRATIPVGGWPPVCDKQKILFTDYLAELDPYGHTRSFENDPHDLLGSPIHYYRPWFGKSQFQKASIQGNLFEANNYSVTLRQASAAAGTPWVIVFAEHHRPVLNPEILNEDIFPHLRQSVWGSLLGGGAGVEWFVQPDDYYLRSFRPFKQVFLWTAYARDFMNNCVPFWEMQPANDLMPENSGYCFAKKDSCYVLYLKDPRDGKLDLSGTSGKFDIFWYDVREGGKLQYGTRRQADGGEFCDLGKPPVKRSSDWVVLVQNKVLPAAQARNLNKEPEKDFLVDIDGNVYQTIKIGNQLWMAENLRVTRYRNGKDIPCVKNDNDWNDLTTGAWCVYDNDENNGDVYGYLYNWYAVNDSCAIAPEDWHVPTDRDWMELERYLGIGRDELINTGYRGTDEGSMLKESGNADWKNAGDEGSNQGGFTALPAGFRDETSGRFIEIGSCTVFWTSDERDDKRAWYRYIKGQFPLIYRYHYPKDGGFSIRCVKD